ncbi:cysteine-tRNA ligase [Cladophialophora bantiana CBS 173.52]|uniref:cysteine--tRNA ligase n=1 Tax=Cladophialophora bantiana (strain ATCC 10958 / CBS 173.52 / CDC B-1940 / NIH 8579) TaxID=1442370 RepID=A0A0D2IJB2_CLAB1|nr:cysteine-tRNA ligase [Cladophialophora bantiana CBS 173.52]KIW96864.1 cysteine-tRNA ligase [Cladophialophora bantiana CBS 173.52]
MSQPPWTMPTGTTHQPQLKVYNSLTRSKVPFVPIQPGHISWYACGPTVYDDSHLGHARNYVTTDIIRRILRDYFGFKIRFVMNTTDIDDKIILRARQRHLYDEYKKNHRYIDDQVRQDAQQAWHYYIQKNLKRIASKDLITPETFDGVIEHTYGDVLAGGSLEPGTKPGDREAKIKMHINTARNAAKALMQDPKLLTPHEFYNRVNDIMCLVLDEQFGSTIRGDDYAVFTKLTKEYEARFFQDMHDLNVMDPDDLVRVTEHGKEIAEFVKKIVDNKMGYRTSDGSVYFDIKAFEAAGYPYARLEPWNRNDKELQADGEGALSQKDATAKRSDADFALWKASKPGEPSWDSEWGPGRPGWHIECSAMASGKLGQQMDIHSGGIDLAFPHHDNELAQSEAFWANHGQWVNYFLHMGHLSIQGSKMSKSLKNFTTIREALHVRKDWTARSLRIVFLLGNWKDGIEITDDMVTEGRNWEDRVDNFFLNAIEAIKNTKSSDERPAGLEEAIQEAAEKVRTALLDSFNTPIAMNTISQLINTYNGAKKSELTAGDHRRVGLFVTRLVNIFGLNGSEPADTEQVGWKGIEIPDAAKEFVYPLAKMRDELRQAAIAKSITAEKVQEIVTTSPTSLEEPASSGRPRPSYARALSEFSRAALQATSSPAAMESSPDLNKQILALCDRVRDIDLWQLDIYLEDRENAPALVRPVTEGLKAARREKEDKARQKEEARKQREREAQEKLQKAKLDPREMFKPPHQTEYSAWDDDGVPTTARNGTPLTASRVKKLKKEWEAQRKAHEKYLATLPTLVPNGPDSPSATR